MVGKMLKENKIPHNLFKYYFTMILNLLFIILSSNRGNSAGIKKKRNLLRVGFFAFLVYKNCAEVYKSGKKISGVYKINPDGLGEFEVFCDQKTAGGGWTVFQKRRDGSVDFFRAWEDYKRGFGNLTGEFWLGLDKIHRLTVSGGYKLRVDLEDLQGKTAFAEYSAFAVTSERAKYQLSLGSYSGKTRWCTKIVDFITSGKLTPSPPPPMLTSHTLGN